MQTDRNHKKFLAALAGQTFDRPPFWYMRQAGRYLPEYRDLRAKAGDFLSLVYNPDFATEVTMQPLRRYHMDAAILFSDILIVPHGLGCDLHFVPGEGPKMTPLRAEESLPVFESASFDAVAGPVYRSVAQIRQQMQTEKFLDTALIGFAGAPWTVATYMVEGGSSRDFIHSKSWAYKNPQQFEKLISVITEATIHYLIKQIEAGAEAIQIFDSWAGALDEKEFYKWVIVPTQKIVAALKAQYADIPIIGFPKGAGMLYETYAVETGVNALSLDSQVPLAQARALQNILPVQGNLDPLALLAGGPAMKGRAQDIIKNLKAGSFIFNLGHGIHKNTPPEHVAALSEIILRSGEE